jgi:cytochrome c-type biogenesis protein CcmF
MSAIRHLFLSITRNKWRGIIGRTNGGMIVHLGVVFLAIGLIASSSYLSQGSYSLQPGESIQFSQSTITYRSAEQLTFPNRIEERVQIEIDGKTLEPSVERFTASGQLVPSPATNTTVIKDIQIALLDPPNEEDKSIVIQVTKQPLLVWIWLGGLIMLIGTVLSAVSIPKRRKILHKRMPKPLSTKGQTT